MKPKFIDAYMDVAERFGKLSSARRLNVGAIIVKDNRIISIGYNGMPTGWDNNCENELTEGKLKSKPEVLHAETNSIAKLAQSNESGLDSTLFVTHSPCLECAKLIYQSGITTIYYKHEYRSKEGVDFLEKCKLNVHQIETIA
jgi:dCMP deaminase|tara:strand:- start:2210 stop:2638 length:429 start_codon:yes stop_codon:yes gene_type:complete